MKVNRVQVHETSVHEFWAEASDLGLKPGEWPSSIETDMGNGQPFVRTRAVMSGDGQDFQGGYYRQVLGCISLTIWND